MARATTQPAAGPSPQTGDRLDRIRPRQVILVVLGYVVALAALRLSLSPFLEIDEAQFVGTTDLRLNYGNSHPPLYNWLVHAALLATRGDYPEAVTLVRGVLLAATHLLVFDAGRRLTGVGGGLIALAAAALLPQVSWMSAHTLAHSLLAMAGAAGVLHGVVLAARSPSLPAFAWIGLAAALGLLGKANVALLVVPLAVALLADPGLRRVFLRPAALAAPAMLTLVAGPIYVLAARDGAGAERLSRLYDDGPFAAVDLPFLGIDGVLSLVVATVASAGIVLAAIAVFGRSAPAEPLASAVSRALWRTLALGLGGSALIVLAADVSLVDERYLTPLMMTVPLLAALHLSAWRHRAWFVVAGGVALLAVPTGIAAMVQIDNHRFARPYTEVAGSFAGTLPPGAPVVVAATAHDLAANLVLALRQRGIDAWVYDDPVAPPATAFVRVRASRSPWPDGDPAPPAGFCPSAVSRTEVPLANWSGKTMALTALTAMSCTGAPVPRA